ncbi:hypothetical protein, partial [Klebsiella variicola]|uniref:hypothetical protein n=1 Tax=Klebsiella variicola TaxID=244366 RepID=UPI0027774E8C|nr:hypothetical protein [Klebsiella variicola]
MKAQQDGVEPEQPAGGLGDIVMVSSVKDARERGVLRAVRPFTHFTSTEKSLSEAEYDAITDAAAHWCKQAEH